MADNAPKQIHDLMTRRWSPRAFDLNHAIDPGDVQRLFEAARWAASCFNAQPWRYVYGVRGQGPGFATILATLAEGNRSWAARASMLIVTITRQHFAHNNQPNAWAEHDLGQANAQLTLQAIEMGLHSHAMGGFDRDRARAQLAIPDGYQAIAVIAIGKQAPAQTLDSPLRERELAEREGLPVQALVFEARFAATS